MKTLKSIIKFIIIATMFVSMVGFFVCELNITSKHLEATQQQLAAAQDELLSVRNTLGITQEDLKFETERSTGLSEKLGEIMGELDELNEELNILKSEEYNVSYLGEFTYTYYCNEKYPHICGGGQGITATGAPTEVGTTIAVDSSVIPLGSMVYVEGIGLRVAQDTGNAVIGNKIDILLNTHSSCFEQTVINGGVWIVSKKTP